jgi:hypothetical protein
MDGPSVIVYVQPYITPLPGRDCRDRPPILLQSHWSRQGPKGVDARTITGGLHNGTGLRGAAGFTSLTGASTSASTSGSNNSGRAVASA